MTIRFNKYRPANHAVIDWRHPITRDLSYFRRLDSFVPTPMYSRINQNMVMSAGSTLKIAATSGGIGMTGTAATDWLIDSPNAFSATNRGSMFAYTTPFWAPTDSLSHNFIGVGMTTTQITDLEFVKFSDNNWYMGFFSASVSFRAIAAASGTFTAGAPMVAGCTWVINGNTEGWVNGKSINVHASPTTLPNVAINNFYIGGSNSFGGTSNAFARDGRSAMHWIALWDRDLNAEEIKYLSSDPNCFLRSTDYFQTGKYFIPWGLADGQASVFGDHPFSVSAVGQAAGQATALGVISLIKPAVANADGHANVMAISGTGTNPWGGAAMTTV